MRRNTLCRYHIVHNAARRSRNDALVLGDERASHQPAVSKSEGAFSVALPSWRRHKYIVCRKSACDALHAHP
jgi:hypothetical protein